MEKCEPIIWRPSESLLHKSYAAKLMHKLNISSVPELWEWSVRDIGAFWDLIVKEIGLDWFKPYERVMDDSKGIENTQWFVGGKINIAHNCVDRHKASPQTALLWEAEDGSVRKISYLEFSVLVAQAANGLKKMGIGPGDSVAIIMPMVPEVVVQLFACFKVGAVAIPIFSGFGSDAIAYRLTQGSAKAIFLSDIAIRRGKQIEVKSVVDQACSQVTGLKGRIVFRRGNGRCAWDPKLDHWWHEYVLNQSDQCPSEVLESESHSLIIFTSGTTGKPKGTIHTHAGVLAQVGKEHRYAFNTDSTTRFFWFTDIGWMMGPWEMIGVTLFGGTLFLYEGAPDYPTPSKLWEMIERHQLTVLGISPTAIRLLMRYGDQEAQRFPMKSLQLLGSTGEPWDPESYLWFFKNVGKERCPIINISGGTEIMGCLLSPLPVQPLKPCSVGGPGLGIDADVFDENGQSVREGIGHLVCKKPIPSMTKGFLNDRHRYQETYFSRWQGIWYHGDWAHVDSDNFWFLHGRSDDTIKIAGKRVGPMEFEAALLDHPSVSEAAAIAVPDSLKGEQCVCFVVLKPGIEPNAALRKELKDQVMQILGKSLAPKEVKFTSLLPKTRSAKILRSLIKKIYLGESISDTASVENLDSIESIKNAS
ncbi:MAG: AMP-binding protein [Deltaproteobacteria bacterium]|nr:AMP-binding protein [Deltaproteobacteria bacterium]